NSPQVVRSSRVPAGSAGFAQLSAGPARSMPSVPSAESRGSVRSGVAATVYVPAVRTAVGPQPFSSAAIIAAMGPAPSAPLTRNVPLIVTIMSTTPSHTIVSTGTV